jgi:hypothetical protein
MVQVCPGLESQTRNQSLMNHEMIPYTNLFHAETNHRLLPIEILIFKTKYMLKEFLKLIWLNFTKLNVLI